MPSAVAIADFNGDLIPDLAVTDLVGNTASILLGEGGGKFAPAVAYAAGFGPTAIAIGDFNGDHLPDLAITDAGAGAVSILLGNSNGTFQPALTATTAYGPYGLLAGSGGPINNRPAGLTTCPTSPK